MHNYLLSRECHAKPQLSTRTLVRGITTTTRSLPELANYPNWNSHLNGQTARSVVGPCVLPISFACLCLLLVAKRVISKGFGFEREKGRKWTRLNRLIGKHEPVITVLLDIKSSTTRRLLLPLPRSVVILQLNNELLLSTTTSHAHSIISVNKSFIVLFRKFL